MSPFPWRRRSTCLPERRFSGNCWTGRTSGSNVWRRRQPLRGSKNSQWVFQQNLFYGLTPYTIDIPNFGQVNDELYRGGQPDLKAMQQLKVLGVKSVINLRVTSDAWKGEQAAATAGSIAYTNIPFLSLSAPTDAQIATVLAAISSMPKPVFVHCQYGCDRTGTVIACYRIQHDHWTNSKALKEAEVHGIARFEVEMRNFIEHFNK